MCQGESDARLVYPWGFLQFLVKKTERTGKVHESVEIHGAQYAVIASAVRDPGDRCMVETARPQGEPGHCCHVFKILAGRETQVRCPQGASGNLGPSMPLSL